MLHSLKIKYFLIRFIDILWKSLLDIIGLEFFFIHVFRNDFCQLWEFVDTSALLILIFVKDIFVHFENKRNSICWRAGEKMENGPYYLFTSRLLYFICSILDFLKIYIEYFQLSIPGFSLPPWNEWTRKFYSWWKVFNYYISIDCIGYIY